MMSVDYDASVRAAEILRRLRHKVFVGGPHPSICPDELEGLQVSTVSSG
jgi:hypothetical protein